MPSLWVCESVWVYMPACLERAAVVAASLQNQSRKASCGCPIGHRAWAAIAAACRSAPAVPMSPRRDARLFGPSVPLRPRPPIVETNGTSVSVPGAQYTNDHLGPSHDLRHVRRQSRDFRRQTRRRREEVFDPPAAPRHPVPSMSAERQQPQRDAQF